MVGVGGRSKACGNCRQRRVKCDLSTPQCKRCIKRGLLCGGRRDITIVRYDGPQRHESSSVPSAASGLRPTDENRPAAYEASIVHCGPLLLDNIKLSVDYDTVFAMYTLSRLLATGTVGAVYAGVPQSLTGKCFAALSTTYFGIQNMDRSIALQGFRRYSRALTELNQILDGPQVSPSFDILEAVGIMAFFEFLFAENEGGWITHSRGLERLLELRGPEAATSPSCLLILERSRRPIVLAALLSHRRTILSKPEWKELPWLAHPERKDSMAFLVDIMADCAELFVLRDGARSNITEDIELTSTCNILNTAYRILHDLERWEEAHSPTSPSCCTQIPSPHTAPMILDSNGQATPLWPTVIQFNSNHQAKTTTLYYSTLVLVLRFILGITSATGGQSDHETLQERVQSAGIVICRTIDYHTNQVLERSDRSFLLFPLRMASVAIGDTNSSVGLWLETISETISPGTYGSASTTYLPAR
ncbi:hypothetical protein GQ53DRAFT_683239 [Thozetella sp. PMI_491]|nr:hypothetical protein GQ53DRAFT_683239 [Thozetella sp. PMI_491]